MKERWKTIPGYAGRYQVSDQGRVRSLDRTIVVFWDDGTIVYRSLKGRVLTPKAAPYLQVMLGRGSSKRVHQLVMLAFVGRCPKGREVVHKNGKHLDCRLANLKYDTHSENHHDITRHGKRPVSNVKVRKFRAFHRSGARGLAALARSLGVSESSAHRISKGQSYTSVGGA